MSNNNNIQNFDSFFKEAFNSFEPQPPQGVFEAIQSQLGTAGAGGSGAAAGGQTLGSIGQWGLGKIIIGAVGTVAVATTIYVATQDNNETTTAENSAPTTEITTTAPTQTATEEENNVEENTNTTTETEEENISAAPNGGTYNNNNTPSANGAAQDAPVVPAPNNAEAPFTNKPESAKPKPNTEKTIVGLYVSNGQLCVSDEVTVTIADDLGQNTYKVNFGDGSTAYTKKGKPTTHVYKTKGRYKITAVAVGANKETTEQWVNVNKPKATFAAENVSKAIFRFTNKSAEAMHYTWFFGDNGEISHDASPTHIYRSFEPQTYSVRLIAMDGNGCLDSFTTKVTQTYTYDDIKPKIYNVFSPGADGNNDHYEIEIENEVKYHLVIMDQAGNTVFESTSKNNTWDGKNMHTGEDCAAATYVMVFVYKIKGFEEQSVRGLVTLRR